MPFVLIIIGAYLLVCALRGSENALGLLLKGDFTGQSNFVYWLVAVLIVGSIGYVPAFRKISDLFLVLLVIVLLISDKGFFAKITSAIQQADSASNATGKLASASANSDLAGAGGSGGTGASGGSGGIGSAISSLAGGGDPTGGLLSSLTGGGGIGDILQIV